MDWVVEAILSPSSCGLGGLVVVSIAISTLYINYVVHCWGNKKGESDGLICVRVPSLSFSRLRIIDDGFFFAKRFNVD